MTKNKLTAYEPCVCEHCRQDTTYELGLDKGSALIVWKIAQFIRQKGINCVHPRKEMEGEGMTSNEVGNLSRPRFHGLIAAKHDEPGNYVLTAKGAKFLRGEPVSRIAIVKKATVDEPAHNIGYHLPDVMVCTFQELVSEARYWDALDFEIVEGRIVNDVASQQKMF